MDWLWWTLIVIWILATAVAVGYVIIKVLTALEKYTKNK